MEREVGSEGFDLPHAYLRSEAHGACICGREEAHELHHAERITETAADTGPALITEKGS